MMQVSSVLLEMRFFLLFDSNRNFIITDIGNKPPRALSFQHTYHSISETTEPTGGKGMYLEGSNMICRMAALFQSCVGD